MPENNETVPSVAGEPTVVAPAGQQEVALADQVWSETPATPSAEIAPAATPAKVEQPATPAPVTPAPSPKEEEIYEDTNDFIKKEFGYENVADAKADIAKLKELQKNATTTGDKAAIKKLIDEKAEHIYSYIDTDKKLKAVQNLEVTSAENAAKILKLNMQFKHKELSADDIEYQYNRLYNMPEKPVQDEDETEAEFTSRTSSWQNQAKNVERAMMIDAKLAKPELSKYTNDLDIPDIQIAAPSQQAEPTAEEKQKAETEMKAFYEDVAKGIGELKSIDVEFKDDEFTIPVSYKIAPEEQQKVKAIVESLYTGWDYFLNRWKNEDGSINALKVAKDIHQFEYGGNVSKKLVQEAATQRLDAEFKKKSNIQLNDPAQRTPVPSANVKDEETALLDKIWGVN